MTQKPVAANQTIAVPTKPVKVSHQELWTSDSTEEMMRLIATAR